MDFRKIIKFGNNSHVVSLPQAWIRKYKLSKGDTLKLEAIGDTIMFSSQKKKVAEKTIDSINLKENSNPKEIKRALISSYENNFDTIIFSSDNIKKHTKTITEFAESYIAMEIVEIRKKEIVCKIYINSDEVNIKKFAKRIDNSIKTMISEIINALNKIELKKRNKESQLLKEDMIQRDKSIDKIVRMIRRIIKERLYKQRITPDETPLDLLAFWQFITTIEELSDNVSRISVLIDEKKDFKNIKQLSKLLEEELEIFSKVMDGFHKSDKKIAYNNSEKIRKHSRNIRKSQKDKPYCELLELIYYNKEFIAKINRLSY